MTSLPGRRRLSRDPKVLGEPFQTLLFPDLQQREFSVGFLARAFIVATLPHSRPESNEFTRRNGYYRLTLLAPTDIGLPYGRYPRPQGGGSPASPAEVHAAYLQDLGTSGRSEPRARPTAPGSRRLAHDGHRLSAHDCASFDF